MLNKSLFITIHFTLILYLNTAASYESNLDECTEINYITDKNQLTKEIGISINELDKYYFISASFTSLKSQTCWENAFRERDLNIVPFYIIREMHAYTNPVRISNTQCKIMYYHLQEANENWRDPKSRVAYTHYYKLEDNEKDCTFIKISQNGVIDYPKDYIRTRTNTIPDTIVTNLIEIIPDILEKYSKVEKTSPRYITYYGNIYHIVEIDVDTLPRTGLTYYTFKVTNQTKSKVLDTLYIDWESKDSYKILNLE